MSEGSTFACDACGKTYAWKPAIAGKKAKCKCGSVLMVPAEEPVEETSLDDLYSLAPDNPVDEGTSARIEMPAPVVATAAPSRGAAGGAAIGYQRGPSARERELEATAKYIDSTRDIGVPVGLLLAGIISYLAFYMFRYELRGGAIAAILVGISVMTVIKAALLIGFAFIIAGPVGVSFGGVGTAALKLAAIAVFADGCQIWMDYGVEKMAGGGGFFNGMLSFPLVIAIYWTLMIYLFSMDGGDAWLVVILLAVFDMILRWVLVLLLLAWVMSMGGVSLPSAVPGAGGGGNAMISETTETFNQLKEQKLVYEGLKYIEDGRQTSLKPHIQAFYDAGAKKVYFSVQRDINGSEETESIVVEMPKEKEKRAAIFKAIQKYYDELKIGDTVEDTGETYEFVEIL